jgi:hypothetical protein
MKNILYFECDFHKDLIKNLNINLEELNSLSLPIRTHARTYTMFQRSGQPKLNEAKHFII